jgi:hypothetical protein
MSASRLVKRARPARWPLALASILSTAVLLAGCSTPLKGSDLASLPEASVVYPGSTLVRTITNDSGFLVQEADLYRLYEVNATQDQIADYYNTKLTSLGWKSGQPCPYPVQPEPEHYYALGNKDIFLNFPAMGSSSTAVQYEYDITDHTGSPRPYPQGWNCATSGTLLAPSPSQR